jgi:hypothetical protein
LKDLKEEIKKIDKIKIEEKAEIKEKEKIPILPPRIP